MPTEAKIRRSLPLAITAAAGALLYVVPASPYYPRCLFHEMTGLLCPGCGATRAVAALLHGHLRDAFQLNALVMLLLPVLLIYVAVGAWRGSWPRVPASAAIGLSGTALLFAVVRNLA